MGPRSHDSFNLITVAAKLGNGILDSLSIATKPDNLFIYTRANENTCTDTQHNKDNKILPTLLNSIKTYNCCKAIHALMTNQV